MKTTYTIAAIAMFAVILGMSALAPAMASRPDGNTGEHKSDLCHYQEAKEAVYVDVEGTPTLVTPAVLEAYVFINVDNKGKMNGHLKNNESHHFPVDAETLDQDGQGDFEITIVEVEATEPFNDSLADCEYLDDNLPAHLG
jgi:hypothetical protein